MKIRIVMLTILSLALAGILLTSCQSTYVTSAKVYIQQDNWDKAIEQLELAVQYTPDNAEAHYLLGSAYAQKNLWEKMNVEFDKSLQLSPLYKTEITNTRLKHYNTNFNSGINRINGGDVDGAIKQFKICHEIDPEQEGALKNLAYCYDKNNDLEGAVEVYKSLVEIAENKIEVYQSITGILFKLKKYDQVIEMEKKALEIDPGNSDAIANIAMAYDFLGDKDQARAEYEKALANNPNDKDLLYNLGRLQYMNKDYDAAIANFQKVIEMDPNDFDSNLNVGNAYLSMGDTYRKTLVDKENDNQTVEPEERDKLKDFYRQSLPYLLKALCLQSEDANLWNNIAVAYVNSGDADKGKACFAVADAMKTGSDTEAKEFLSANCE